MPIYSIRSVTRDGSLIKVVDLDYDSDKEAIASAGALAPAYDVQIWQGERWVGTVHPRYPGKIDD